MQKIDFDDGTDQHTHHITPPNKGSGTQKKAFHEQALEAEEAERMKDGGRRRITRRELRGSYLVPRYNQLTTQVIP